MIDWCEIDTVLLDMDGTLLDLRFDNWFWQEYIPEKYGALRGLTPEQAWKLLAPKFRAALGTLEWYCLDYWASELELDIREAPVRELLLRVNPPVGLVGQDALDAELQDLVAHLVARAVLGHLRRGRHLLRRQRLPLVREQVEVVQPGEISAVRRREIHAASVARKAGGRDDDGPRRGWWWRRGSPKPAAQALAGRGRWGRRSSWRTCGSRCRRWRAWQCRSRSGRSDRFRRGCPQK